MNAATKEFFSIILFFCITIFAFVFVMSFMSCNTIIKDEPEIEKVIEDGTKELIEDAIKVSISV